MSAAGALGANAGVLRAPSARRARAVAVRGRGRVAVRAAGAPFPRGRSRSSERAAREKTPASRQHTVPLAPDASRADPSDATRTRAVPLGGAGAGPIANTPRAASVGVRAVSVIDAPVEAAPRVADPASPAARAVRAPRENANPAARPRQPHPQPEELPNLRAAERRFLQLHPGAPEPGSLPGVGPRSVTLVNDRVRLWITTDGRLRLRRVDGERGAAPRDRLVARSRVELPREASEMDGVITRVDADDDGTLVGAEIRWGDVARLRVESTGDAGVSRLHRTRAGWNERLAGGFVVDFAVNPDATADPERAMAELTVELEESGDWFGGGHLMRQHWPLNLGCWEVGPHYPFDNGPNGVNTLVSTHWVTSGGLAVLADPDIPYLHVGLNAPRASFLDKLWSRRSFGVGIQNATREMLPMTHELDRHGDGALRLQARAGFERGRGAFQMEHPMIGWEAMDLGSMDEGVDADYEPESQWLSMRAGLCAASNVRDATELCLATLARPSAPPPADVIRSPIWTTWARYKHNVDQRKTLTFAREIVANGLTGSVMEIDDKWQSGYGELDFDLDKFPDPKAMVDELHDMGFKVTLWVMPFVEEDTEAYREGAPLGYFVQSDASHGGLKPGFFKWWNAQPVVALDVTNPKAVAWFVARLEALREKYGIDGYKFDAGEPCFLPRRMSTHRPLAHPSEYTRAWVERVAARFELAEVRTGHQTTGMGLLTRMGDRFSEWGNGNGLRSIIPTLLTSGVMGYPFCLPDMIGGNAYFGRRPDRELLVRWAQANALMPAMQFSIAPWDAGADVAELCRASLALRDSLADAIVGLTDAECDSLAPVCRPMWWLDPEDPETFRITDQYAIGDDIIVAPVVRQGERTRDVYLTEGLWVEAHDPDGEVFVGGQWARKVAAPLEKLPCFLRVIVGDEESCDVLDEW